MRYSYFFDWLLYKLVKILDTDKLLYLSPKVIMLISHAGQDELEPMLDHFKGVGEAVLRCLRLESARHLGPL